MVSAVEPPAALTAGSEQSMERLLPEWRALWARARQREPFAHPDWLRAHLAAFEPAVQPELVTARAGDTLVAVLPLIHERVTADGMTGRWLRAPMNPHWYRVAVLHAGGDPAPAARAVWDGIASRGGWDIFSVPRFARGGFIDELAACARTQGFPTLLRPDQPTNYVPLPVRGATEGDAPWLSTAGSGLQSHIRKSFRQAIKELGGSLTLKRCEAADPVQLQRFYDIEASGWKGHEGTAIACSPQTLQFYNAVAERLAAEGAFVLHLLCVNDLTLAGSYGVGLDGVFYPLKWGYDESYAKYRPGRVMTAETLRDCFEHDCCVFDMGVDEPHKREWTPHLREHGTLYIFSKGVTGRLLHYYRSQLGPLAARTLKRLRPARAEQA